VSRLNNKKERDIVRNNINTQSDYALFSTERQYLQIIQHYQRMYTTKLQKEQELEAFREKAKLFLDRNKIIRERTIQLAHFEAQNHRKQCVV
jgi:hypothetical protein